MDVWRLTVAVLRRWYILLPLLALSGLAALQAGAGIQPQYESTATAMLVPGQGQSEVPNPYGSMSGTSEIVAIVLTSNESRANIEAMGLSPRYEVSAGSRSAIIRYSAVAATPELAIATLDAVLQATRDELSTRQGEAGVPSAAQYGVEVLQAPSISTVVADGKTRIMAVVGLLGAALAFLVSILFDDLVGIIKRWRRSRRERRTEKRNKATRVEDASQPSAADDPDTVAVGAGDDAHEPDLASPDDGTEPDGDGEDREVSGDGAVSADADDGRLARAGRDG